MENVSSATKLRVTPDVAAQKIVRRFGFPLFAWVAPDLTNLSPPIEQLEFAAPCSWFGCEPAHR